MNIMNRLTWRAMWKNKTRTIVTIIGIILSAAMFTAVVTLGVSLLNYVIRTAVYTEGDWFVRYHYSSAEDLEALREAHSVSQLGIARNLGFTTFELNTDARSISEDCIVAACDDAFLQMAPIHLEEGRLPQSGDEIVITRNVYHYLRESGMPCEVGETLELAVRAEYEGLELPVSQGTPFTKQYTITGITEIFLKLNPNLSTSSLITYADGTQPEPLWYTLYVKTNPPSATYDLADTRYGLSEEINTKLLNLYGATKYSNYNTFITAICAVMMGIIMLGSVSLIHNAFSISVSERTKQFGLLGSIGATRKQLRQSVYFEALSLSAIGIPIGIFFGYLGIAVTLHFTSGLIDNVLAGALEGNIHIYAVASAPAFVCAGVVALLTVFLSARRPAKKAARIMPLAAIRQSNDYQLPPAGKRKGSGSLSIGGLSGMLAKKYYTVSKKKYRATVISLTISIVLLLTTFSFSQLLRGVSETSANIYNFDLDLNNPTQEQIDQLRSSEYVDRSALATHQQLLSYIPSEDLTQEYIDACGQSPASGFDDYNLNIKHINIYYLEDSVFTEFLAQQGLDPAPYFDADQPAALLCNAKISAYQTTEDGMEKLTFHTGVLQDGVEYIRAFQNSVPSEVYEYVAQTPGSFWPEIRYENDMLIWVYDFFEEGLDTICIAVKQSTDENGNTLSAFFLYDPETGTVTGEPIAQMESAVEQPSIRIAERVDTLPYGIPSLSGADVLSLIMPLSRADTHTLGVDLVLSINNYSASTALLDEMEIDYIDHLQSQMQYRNLQLMINIFSYGFIILITLICICNVFNTISTNIALRRRDFGMLKSVGMKNGQLHRMLALECLRYGLQAMLFGLPIGLGIGCCIYSLDSFVGKTAYPIPWAAIVLAIFGVFIVVAVSMLYAVKKMRKDSPIDAIRMENL